LIQKFYDLQGASLRVSAIQPVLVDCFGRIFAGRSRTLPTAPLAFGLTIASGEPEQMPADAELLYDGPILGEGNALFWQEPGQRVLSFPGAISLALRDDAREATIIVAAGAEDRIVMTCGQLALQAALLAADQFLVHAAGLTLPDNRVALIFGRSGAGKTTSTLALAAGGLGLCSDDAMACSTAGDHPTAWGLPRNLKVHRRTAEMLPWVQPLLTGDWDAEDERPLMLSALRSTVSVEAIAAREVAAIFLLERSGTAASRCEPASKADVLAMAAADNVRATRVGVPKGEHDLFKRLGGLVRALPTYRLLAGANPTDLATVMLAALNIEKITA
jgi:hypothetical protein